MVSKNSSVPLYHVWLSMRERCNNSRHPRYKSYGGRGIKVCPRWDSYELFIKDIASCPGKGYSLDRIDNDGDYEPSNIRWATHSTQARNRRNNKLSLEAASKIRELYKAGGTTHRKLADEFEVSYRLIYDIIHEATWV